MKNILFVILLFLSFSVFGQKWTLGTVPPTGTEQRINQTTQLRKGTKPNQFHITRGDNSVVFMDQDTVAQILGIGSGSPVKYYTLNTVGDTSTYKALAQLNCPSLAVAKLDSCSISYLFMFNCGTGSWELFKTPNIYTAGKTLFVDEITGNDATAKKGCPTCAFKEPYGAFRSATEYIDGNTVKVEAGNYSLGFIGDGTSKEVPAGPYELSTDNYSTGIDTFRLHLEQGANIKFTQSRGIGTPHPAWVGWSTQPKYIGITGYGTFNSTNGTLFHHAVADGTFYMNIDKIETGYSVGEFMNKESVFNIGTINQTQGLTDYGGGLFFGPSLLSKTTRPKYSAKIKNWNVIDNRNAGFFTSIIDVQGARWSEVSDGLQNANISVSIDNLDMKSYRNGLLNLYKYVADFDSNRIDISVNNIKYEGMNTETFTLGSVFQPDHLNAIFSQTGENFAEHINNTEVNIVLGNIQAKRFNITGQLFNIYNYIGCKIHIDAKNAILKEGVGLKFNGVAFDNTTIVIEGNWEIDYPAIYLIGCTFNNSKIIFKGNFKNTTANPLFYFNNCTFTDSKFIADGNFSTPDKILMVTGGSFDANSVIELQGTFKTTSSTLPAIDINNSRLFLKDCDIITGGGYSIDSATPVNVTVKPGCASNVTTSANVTQLGTGIYVDPNFNN